MNAHDPALSGATDHTAALIRDAWIVGLRDAPDLGDDGAGFRVAVGEAARECLQLAHEGLLDEAEAFEAIERAANDAGQELPQVIRGILAGVAPDLYIPEAIIPPLVSTMSAVVAFKMTAGKRMAATYNGDRLPTFQAIALECGQLVPDQMTAPDAGDFLQGLAVSSGLIDAIGQHDLQHVIAEALKGRPAIAAKAATAKPRQDGAVSDRGADHGQIPLVAELAPAEAYPVRALGPTLSRGAEAIARKIQAPIEMAAQSVLAVAALAAQAQADVQLPFGQTRPLSLALVTVASSGDRKTSTDREAAWPVRTCEQELSAEYSEKLERYRINLATWEAEKKRIEGEKKLDRDGRALLLENLGPAPLAPLFPFITAPEPTIEGLIKAMPRALPSLGLFSAEGGQFVGGHGMSTDNRLKTASGLSGLWDGEPVKRIRAGDGVSILRGRRLSLHMMIQPDIAASFLTDPLLRDQGLLSRILVAAPCSIAGTRIYQETTAADEAAIREYGGHILRLLRKPWPLAHGTDNELLPRVLPMSDESRSIWRAFHDEAERQIGAGGRLAPVRDFAGKAAEHAGRIAGVLTIVADADAVEIEAGEMADAVELVRWHLGEALRLCAAYMTDPATRHAVKLLEWLRVDYPGGAPFGLRDIVRFGPAELRRKSAAESAMRKLCDHGYAAVHSPKPLKWSLGSAADEARSRVDGARARGDAW